MVRWLLLALVIIGLAPGTVFRTPTGLRTNGTVVTVTPLAARAGVSGEMALTGAWELTAPHGWFGGFSALVATGSDGLIAGSDRGWLLDIDLSGPAPRVAPDSFRFIGLRTNTRDEVVDLESLARDPATGTLWAAYEDDNRIERLSPGGARAHREPREMARWSANSGPETMVRLGDGRFVVIAEGSERNKPPLHRALRFADDPVKPGKSEAFYFAASPGYDPVDAVALPDGRVLILLRRVEYTIPVGFDTAIAIADSRRIAPGGTWRAQIIQRLQGGVFADNFEGIAFVPSAADPGKGAVWLISDDNLSAFQKNLLVRFDWEG